MGIAMNNKQTLAAMVDHCNTTTFSGKAPRSQPRKFERIDAAKARGNLESNLRSLDGMGHRLVRARDTDFDTEFERGLALSSYRKSLESCKDTIQIILWWSQTRPAYKLAPYLPLFRRYLAHHRRYLYYLNLWGRAKTTVAMKDGSLSSPIDDTRQFHEQHGHKAVITPEEYREWYSGVLSELKDILEYHWGHRASRRRLIQKTRR